jgi:anaerobic sulfite reductase subunit B
MMKNPVMPSPCKILGVTRENESEYTFRVETDITPAHGQFLQLSIPKVGEAPISVSGFGEGYLDFTIRSVGKVTKEMFDQGSGDVLFLRGAYGIGWPIDMLQGKRLVVITGGTGLAPVRSLLRKCMDEPGFVKGVFLVCGFKSERGILFRGDLEAYGKRFETIYTLDDERIDGWESGFVTEHVAKIPLAEYGDDCNVLIVGPPRMMRFTALECIKHGAGEGNIWVSFERRMSCAIGKCGHCRIDETYVCTDGPVFNYQMAKNLVD